MPTKLTKTAAMMLLWTLLVSGCGSPPRPLPVRAKDHTGALLLHPEFEAAATVAPNFVKAALREITELETQLANTGHE